jgi:hypothetical protein
MHRGIGFSLCPVFGLPTASLRGKARMEESWVRDNFSLLLSYNELMLGFVLQIVHGGKIYVANKIGG